MMMHVDLRRFGRFGDLYLGDFFLWCDCEQVHFFLVSENRGFVIAVAFVFRAKMKTVISETVGELGSDILASGGCQCSI